ncbi:hypothetical protein LTR97_004074 [Elasticomyces elasticus]|uniref:Uncharacterized protein n=1 Tax=Elasticomyces elasticus TaxID=574655 RepID=A0AAN7WF78_9PEZI|nr:hypothetical protein LTR97_004074 [Elasticomyces elasticus]
MSTANEISVAVEMEGDMVLRDMQTSMLRPDPEQMQYSHLTKDNVLSLPPIKLPSSAKTKTQRLSPWSDRIFFEQACLKVVVERRCSLESRSQSSFQPPEGELLEGELRESYCFRFRIMCKGFDFSKVHADMQAKAEAYQTKAQAALMELPPRLPPFKQGARSEVEVMPSVPQFGAFGDETPAHTRPYQVSQDTSEQTGGRQHRSVTAQETAIPTPRPKLVSTNPSQPGIVRPVGILKRHILEFSPSKTRAQPAAPTPPATASHRQTTHAVPNSTSEEPPQGAVRTETTGSLPKTPSSLIQPRQRPNQAVTAALRAGEEPIEAEPKETQQMQPPTQKHVDVDLTLDDDEDVAEIKQEAGAAHTRMRQVVALAEDDAEDDDELESQKRVMALRKQKIEMEKQRIELEMEEIEFERKMREREREKKRKRVVAKLEK